MVDETSSTRYAYAEVLESARRFVALKEEWESLYHNSPVATPFQSWAWLYSWWESYGADYDLRLVTVRNDEGLLVGILPFMTQFRRGFRRLLFVGTGHSDYCDVIVRAGWEDAVSEAGVHALGRIESWHIADLAQLRPTAATWTILRRWGGPHLRQQQVPCPVMEVKPWDEMLASLGSRFRQDTRRVLRRAEADGIRFQQAEPADAERAARRLVTLHREMWSERGINPEHSTQRFEAFLVAAARRMLTSGSGVIFECRRDGEVIISSLCLYAQSFLTLYLPGVSQEARQRHKWSTLNLWQVLEFCRSKNISRLHMGQGTDPYKLRWNPKILPTYRLILGHHRTIWVAYAAYHTLVFRYDALRSRVKLRSRYHALRSRLKLYARYESLPWLMRSAAREYSTLRSVISRCIKGKG